MLVPVDFAHELYEEAGEPKELIIGKGRNHSELSSFFTSEKREDGAIRLTLEWLSQVLK